MGYEDFIVWSINNLAMDYHWSILAIVRKLIRTENKGNMNLINMFLRGLGNVQFSSLALLNSIKADLGKELQSEKSKLKNGKASLNFKFSPGSLKVDALARGQHPTKRDEDAILENKQTVGVFMLEGQSFVFNSPIELMVYLADRYPLDFDKVQAEVDDLKKAFAPVNAYDLKAD